MAGHQKIDAFELSCWRRLLRVPWTPGRSNQSILKEINPEYSLEGLMLKLKLQYLGHLMQRANSQEKALMLGLIEGKRRRGRQRMRWLDGITDSMDMNLSKFLEIAEGRGSWHAAAHGVTKSWTWLSNWTIAYLKQVTNKNLLYSTGKYIQYPVINHYGKESEKKNIYTYCWISLLYVWT